MTYRLLTAASFAALLCATSANAQGWHISALGGGVWAPHTTLSGTPQALDSGFNAGGRVGYDLDDWFGMSGLSFDADLFYTQSHFSGVPNGRLSSLSFMGDLIYRVPLSDSFGLYAGGGVGAVRIMLNTPGVDDGSTVFGWQGLGGVDFQFTPETRFFVEYRYQEAHDANIAGITGVGNHSNNVSVGLKFDL